MVAFTGVELDSSGPRSSTQLDSVWLGSPRRDTDAILSYYQSAAADGAMSDTSLTHNSVLSSSSLNVSPTALNSRSISSISTSSSAYSSESSKVPPVAPSAYKPPQQRTVLPFGLNGTTRRLTIPSEGGADRRRMAVVETGTEDGGSQCGEYPRSDITTSGSPSSNLRSLRGLEAQLGGLALVAPPDTSSQMAASLTPPLTVPVQLPFIHSQSSSSTAPSHVRSFSEAVEVFGRGYGHTRKLSREVVVIGTTPCPHNPSDPHLQNNSSPVTEALRTSVFQMPQSRPPSPGTPEASDSGSSTAPKSRRRKDALFPGVSPIKELKETLSPTASPVPAPADNGSVVVNPESPSPLIGSLAKPSTALAPKTDMSPVISVAPPYLYYQPGLHAKAGPLPPPPIAVFSIDPRVPPPPRPIRHSPLKTKGDMEAVKRALALPPSVAAVLKARIALVEPKEDRGVTTSNNLPSPVVEKELSPTLSTDPSGSSLLQMVVPQHQPDATNSHLTVSPKKIVDALPRHESIDDLVASVGRAIDDMGIIRSSEVPPPTVLEPMRHNGSQGSQSGLDIRRISPTPTPPLEQSIENEKGGDVLPPLPAKNERQSLDLRVKSALSMKRFSSLPRTPSRISLNRLSTGSKKSSRTPSPLGYSGRRAPPPVKKVRSAWPPAMHFADVMVKKNALDRSVGYAQKINELYIYDCGLGDWVVETRFKSANPQKSSKRANMKPGPRAPSTHSPRSQTRNISESSTGSEVTFPRRPDAYLATDLLIAPSGDSTPPNAPPPLPYPALAAAPRNGSNRASTMMASSSSSSGRSLASPTSSSKSPASFFTSLGRKTSIKKEKSAGSTAPIIGRVLSRSPPRPEPNPRPVVIPNAPSVPGGPRAPPNRMQRSQTIIISPQSPPKSSAPYRSSTVIQRSLQPPGGRNTSDRALPTDPDEFAHQVDKLAALLPKADRTVLAGYLLRAGQDILAIGQYLEDEKNGTLRYD